MAIGPEQLTDSFNEDVRNFERYIDLALSKKNFNGYNKVSVGTPAGISALQLQVLIEHYLKAGWKSVTRDFGNQRDSYDILTFEK